MKHLHCHYLAAVAVAVNLRLAYSICETSILDYWFNCLPEVIYEGVIMPDELLKFSIKRWEDVGKIYR